LVVAVDAKKILNAAESEHLTEGPLFEIIAGTPMLIFIIFVHGAGIRIINRRFNQGVANLHSTTRHWRIDFLLVATIAALAALHFVETLIWATPIYVGGFIPNMRDSYYYVLESYTTLGEGNISLPDKWRLIGPIIAMSGLFTFGWTGSVLVNVMSEFSKLDRARTKEPKD
jgi:hypothetical protein